MKLFLDESGYTGEDLINKDQPVFVLASNVLTDEECQEFFREIFKDIKTGELKHKELSKDIKGQTRIIELVKALQGKYGKVVSSVAHKEFVLLTMLVDWWVEPSMRQHGIDLYDRGGNIGLCNLIYLTLFNTEGPSFLEKHLGSFQIMMRKRTSESYRTFWNDLRGHFDNCDKLVRDTLLWFLGGEKDLGFNYLTSLPEKTMDIAVTTAMLTVSHWRDQTGEQLEVIHDMSSRMAKQKWLWDQLVGAEISPRIVGYDRRRMQFPLNVNSTQFCDSRDYLQLQYADLIAGSTAKWAEAAWNEAKRSKYTDALEEAGISKFIVDLLWPTDKVTPEELGTDSENAGNIAEFLAPKIEIPNAKITKKKKSGGK